MYIIVVLLFTLINAAPLCSPGSTRLILNFDDISAPYGTQSIPRPYNGLIFQRINTPYTDWPNDLAQAVNITYQSQYFPEYTNTASSPPNGIYTAREIMSVKMATQKTFGLANFKLTSVRINNMSVFVNITKTNSAGKITIVNSTVIIINVGTITTVDMNYGGVEGFTISCVNNFNCDDIIYDDIDVCK